MKYEGKGTGEQFKSDGKSKLRGKSRDSIDDAIRAAVHFSDVPDRTTLVVESIEVTTEGDPHVGEYRVVLAPGG